MVTKLQGLTKEQFNELKTFARENGVDAKKLRITDGFRPIATMMTLSRTIPSEGPVWALDELGGHAQLVNKEFGEQLAQHSGPLTQGRFLNAVHNANFILSRFKIGGYEIKVELDFNNDVTLLDKMRNAAAWLGSVPGLEFSASIGIGKTVLAVKEGKPVENLAERAKIPGGPGAE